MKRLKSQRSRENARYALRDVFNDLGTGVSDDDAAKEGSATSKSEDLLLKLHKSDTFNRRKMCEIRESILTDDYTISDPNIYGKNETPRKDSSAAEKFQNRTKNFFG